jgi:DNA-directed RNA polymerase subunit RPC12/RpoP
VEKRKLSAIPRETASEDMLKMADSLGPVKHIVTASLVEDGKILVLYFYENERLKKGNTEPALRTFMSADDYITQDLSVSKVKWLTASFYSMENVDFFKSRWNYHKNDYDRTLLLKVRSDDELNLINEFFKNYVRKTDEYAPWTAIFRFQEEVLSKRLDAKHKKETDVIDAVMDPIKEAPHEFFDWVWNVGMSFSRYLIYREVEKGMAECQCTHCKKIGIVDRNAIRLRNNEKGTCPFCGSRVTFKARGRMASQRTDERYFAYVDPTSDGFILRYFHACRTLRNDSRLEGLSEKSPVREYIHEDCRAIYTFPEGKPKCDSYEWGVYKQRGPMRWCPDQGRIACMQCILYPENLPAAWKHTPMKYSALEYLSRNIPTESCQYERGIKVYMDFPKLEWLCKMGLNQLAKLIIAKDYYGSTGKLNLKGNTIYEILGLNKVNTRILQEIDGNADCLRLLQVAQQIGIQFKSEQLKEYYETFGCNTDLIKSTNRKVSLHKLVKYISKESVNYPIGERGGCWMYSYNRYREREDPRDERKRNMAHDWLEYLGWCGALKYDLDNMFIYMPKNFKKVHDRTAQEYQELQDRKKAEEKRRREALAKKCMEEMKKYMEEIFDTNDGSDAFSIKGKGLVLVVPKNGDEIRAEGAALHHCVGSYVESVAKGKTSIFFVRKAAEPDKPYFTMEFRDNRIIQCRGSHNCGMPAEVEAFVKVFEKKMQDAASARTEEKTHRKAG